MKNKKYMIYDFIIFVIFFSVMGALIDKLSLIQWLIIAVIVELIAQVSGQFIFKEKEEQDNHHKNSDKDE